MPPTVVKISTGHDHFHLFLHLTRAFTQQPLLIETLYAVGPQQRQSQVKWMSYCSCLKANYFPILIKKRKELKPFPTKWRFFLFGAQIVLLIDLSLSMARSAAVASRLPTRSATSKYGPAAGHEPFPSPAHQETATSSRYNLAALILYLVGASDHPLIVEGHSHHKKLVQINRCRSDTCEYGASREICCRLWAHAAITRGEEHGCGHTPSAAHCRCCTVPLVRREPI